MKKYEFFDHTADVGLRVYGQSLPALFENAGFALFEVLTDTARVMPRQTESFSLQRDTTEELLVEWLGGLLYRFDTSGLLFSRFRVHALHGPSLSASAGGEPFEPAAHELRTAVKAVTYHGLAITRRGDLWQATVILDV